MTNHLVKPSERIDTLVEGTSAQKIVQWLMTQDPDFLYTSTDVAEGLGLGMNTVTSRLTILFDNGYVGREKIDGRYSYFAYNRKRRYSLNRRTIRGPWKKTSLMDKDDVAQVIDATPKALPVKEDPLVSQIVEALDRSTLLQTQLDVYKQKFEAVKTKLSEVTKILESL